MKRKKRVSTSIAIKEMQIEATVRCHFTPIRTAIIFFKRGKKTGAGEDADKLGTLCIVGGNVKGYSWRNQYGESSKR